MESETSELIEEWPLAIQTSSSNTWNTDYWLAVNTIE